MRNRARLLIAAAFVCGSVLSCSGTPTTTANSPATDGTVSGAVTSSLGGGIASVSVVVTPTGGSALPTVTTNSAGAYSVPSVPAGTAGTGTIAIAGVPSNCTAPTTQNYSGLADGSTTTANVSVTCVTPVDTIAGQVTSSLGGGVGNVIAVVTPTGQSALPAATTNSGGAFTVTGVGTGGGSIALSNIPNNCVTPSPTPYTGKAAGGKVPVPITLQCSAAAGAIVGTVRSSQGNISIGAGVSVTVTPHGASALPAVPTNASGVFTITGVPVSDGTGSLTFSNLPSNCPTPTTATSYSGLGSSKTDTITVTITCSPPAGVITGTISSSLGGGLSGVSVIVTPSGGTALAAVTTGSNGTFTVSGVPVGSGANAGGGTVTINHLTPNCTAPTSPSSYTGLTNGTDVTVNITVTCTTPYGVIRGTLVMPWGQPIPGVQAVATPTGGNPIPAQGVSDSTGLFVIVGVPVGNGANAGTGTVSFTLPPVNCPTINSQSYSALTNAHQVTLYLVPSCTRTGALLLQINPEGSLVPTNTANVTMEGPGTSTQITTIAQPGLVNPLNPGKFAFDAFTYETVDQTVPQIFSADSLTLGHVALPIDTAHTFINVGLVDTVGVSYGWRAGTGELWVADSSTLIMAGFSGPDLRQGGAISATSIISQSNPLPPTGLALDSTDRLWTSLGTNNQIIRWRDSAEYGGTYPTYVMASVTAGLNNPQGLAFDKNGLLWAANAGSDSLIGITLTGSITKTLTSSALTQATGVAFDASGNLWVSNVGNSTIVEFTAAQLSAAGAQTPTIVLSATGSSLSSPTGLAFDPSGNLWVTNSAANTVVELSASSLSATGSPAPAVSITASSGSLSGARALAFDFGGNLWVANETANTVVEYSAAQLVSGGSVAPVGSVNSPGGVIGGPLALVFNPQPTNLPINGSRVTRIFRGGLRFEKARKATVKRR